MSADTKALALQILHELWNQKTPALIEDLFATNCVIHTPDGTLHGLAGAKQLYAAYVSSCPDVHFTIEDMVADEHKAAIRYLFRGTHQGALKGIAPTGKSTRVAGAVFFYFVDGKVIEQRGIWDSLDFMQQLGVISLSQ